MCDCYPCWIFANLPGYEMCPPCLGNDQRHEAPDDGPTLLGGWELAEPDYVEIEAVPS